MGTPVDTARALRDVVTDLGADIPTELRDSTLTALDLYDERMSRSPEHTVIAIGGTTGSGKSSLINAITCEKIAVPGYTRPTTRTSTAAFVPTPGAEDLVQWMGIPNIVHLSDDSEIGAGTILIDLPDVDSVETGHHALAGQAIERVDLLVWVVDPQKYADDVVHRQWLAPMRHHAKGIIVVLNKIDTLTVSGREEVLADLRRLIHEDGMRDSVILGTSATEGIGVAQLRRHIYDSVGFLRGQALRAVGEVREQARKIRQQLDVEPDKAWPADPDMASDLATTIIHGPGISSLLADVDTGYRRASTRATGWLPVRAVAAVRRNPLVARHLPSRELGNEENVTLSVPTLSAGEKSAVFLRLRDEVLAGQQRRAQVWNRTLASRAETVARTLPQAIDNAVARMPIQTAGTARWWHFARLAQDLGWIVALIGVVWLTAIHLAQAYLFLPLPRVPIHEVPLPTWLFIGGVVWTVLVAIMSGLISRWQRHRAIVRIKKDVHSRVAEAVDVAIDPLQDEFERQRRIIGLLREITAA